MNCLPNISIALSLISLTAGVWFLYKTQKENLSILFKIAAWFVIIVALLNMACCGLRCCMQGCKMKKECKMEMYGGGMGMNHCGMNMGNCGMMMNRGMNCCPMMANGNCKEGRDECKEGKEECDEMMEGKCADMEKGKCKDMEGGKCKMMMKKDSVVKKNK